MLDNIFKRPKFIGLIRRKGWRDYMPFYRVFCAVPGHGYFDDYPHGHYKKFQCPKCRETEDVNRPYCSLCVDSSKCENCIATLNDYEGVAG